MTLTGRAAAVALLGVLVVLAVRSAVTVAVVDGLLLAAIVTDMVLAAPVKGLQLMRSGDARVRLGEEATVRTTVVNTSRRTLRGQLRDAWPPSAGARPERATLRIPRGGQATVAMVVTPVRHGDCDAEMVTVRSVGPLGLAGRQRGQRVPWRVRALPPFDSRKHLPGKLARLRQLDGQHRAVLPGQGGEFDSLREYVIGDDVRSIDWRSTARRHDVLVRTYRPERSRRILFLLDTGRTSAGRVAAGGVARGAGAADRRAADGAVAAGVAAAGQGAGDWVAGYPRLDAAMEAVQLLTALASQAGDRVDLIAVDHRLRARVLAPSRTTALAMVTDALATLDADLSETDWRLAAATVLATARQRCLVVLLTDLNPSVALAAELHAVTGRHELLVAAVADPRLALLAGRRGDAAAVYAAAAASRAMAERARAAAQLTRMGATVVDAPPDKLPPALADAYLTLKAKGKL